MIITDPDDLAKFLGRLGTCLAFDTETVAYPRADGKLYKKDALVLGRARIIMASFCGKEKGKSKEISCCVPLSEHYGSKYMSTAKLMRVVKPVFENPAVQVWAHNMNYDYNVMANQGVLIANPNCTIVEGKLYNENLPGSLKDMAVLVGMLLHKTKNIDFADVAKSSEYAEQDAIACWKLKCFYDAATSAEFVPENRFIWEYQEKPLIAVVTAMERRGVYVDKNLLSNLNKECTSEIRELTKRIFSTVGFTFNLRSPQQLADVLYGKLGVPEPPRKKSTSKHAPTDERTLFELKEVHEVIPMILEYRTLSKVNDTYLDMDQGIASYADSSNRIIYSLNQFGAVTGRASSSNPNLQNIPSKGKWGKLIRSVFVAPKGQIVICLDYKMFELCILANFCAFLWKKDGEKGLDKLPLLCNTLSSGGDLHSVTAQRLSVTRFVGKTLNFGLIYGMGPSLLKKHLYHSGILVTKEVATDYVRKFFEAYPEIELYKRSVIGFHRKHGYIKYISGRIRRVPDVNSSDGFLRSKAERQVVNSPIQGTCADWMKQAMLRIEEDRVLKSLGVSQALQVHDELMLYMPKRPYGNIVSALDRLSKLMVEPVYKPAIPIEVPVEVTGGAGKSWSAAKK